MSESFGKHEIYPVTQRAKEQESQMFQALALSISDDKKERIAALKVERDEWAEDLLVAKADQFKLNVDIKSAENVLSDAYMRRLKTEVAITRLAYLICDVDSEIEELEKK